MVAISKVGEKEIEMGWDMGNSNDPFGELNDGCFLYYFSMLYVFYVCVFLVFNVRKKNPQCLLFVG